MACERQEGLKMKLILKILVGAISVYVASYLIPGVEVASLETVVIVAVVLGALNAFVKPILTLLTLPITLLTLGLFSLVINTVMVLFVDYLIPGFDTGTILNAFLFSIVLSLIGAFLSPLAK